MLIEVPALMQNMIRHNRILLYCRLKPVNKTATFAAGYIPGSKIFDLAEFSSLNTQDSPPDAFEFNRRIRKLGASYDSDIVVYDPIGIYAAPRVWFELKLMGYENVSVLNGGLPEWLRHKGPTESSTKAPATEPDNFLPDFPAKAISNKIANATEVLNAISHPDWKILDVRNAGRFAGTEPEPRPGIRRGHIPTATNIPYTDFLKQEQFRPVGELQAMFHEYNCHPGQTLVFYCGSGVTACIGYFAAHLCGYQNLRIYGGSWMEWGAAANLPLAP